MSDSEPSPWKAPVSVEPPPDSTNRTPHPSPGEGRRSAFEGIATATAEIERLRAELVITRAKIRRQAAEIRIQQEAAERKNRELDALHLVWCDGGCPSGVHRWSDLIVTEDLVKVAERNARRLRRWYNGVRFRLGLAQRSADKWFGTYAVRAAAKTDLAVVPAEGDT